MMIITNFNAQRLGIDDDVNNNNELVIIHNADPRMEERAIRELYPNPDEMTYEELLALQEKIGYVNKGMSKEQINVILKYINSLQ
jgi:hypothetical protein